MANENSLKNLKRCTPSEAREQGRKGGYASGKARQQKKTLKSCLEQVMSLKVADDETRQKLIDIGIKPKDVDYMTSIIVALVQQAQKGNVAAFDRIRDLLVDSATDSGRLDKLIEGLKNG